MNATFGNIQRIVEKDYNQLVNIPTINGVEVKGDLTSDDLHIAGIGFDYETAINKPKIEGVELVGNKTFKQLGIEPMSVTEIEKILYLNV